ncbi:hypothetical protein VB716_12380 [Synechococcus sp. CCY9201]|uniref:hypothetical protein n=1 Tax=Synechococcus sp. CCY9201 TaxID=174697 RepID=UPI002B1F38CB|nr:hypothetical protein [Synechococcus sp. CCY9201]MEA5475018.1 hypothetical protein [Synechococcus sp. CCY9201]
MEQLSAPRGAAHQQPPRPVETAWEAPLPTRAAPAGAQVDRWNEFSVVELRALLRSYPIDRRSLPAPIELLRREELLEAQMQLAALMT